MKVQLGQNFASFFKKVKTSMKIFISSQKIEIKGKKIFLSNFKD